MVALQKQSVKTSHIISCEIRNTEKLTSHKDCGNHYIKYQAFMFFTKHTDMSKFGLNPILGQ